MLNRLLKFGWYAKQASEIWVVQAEGENSMDAVHFFFISPLAMQRWPYERKPHIVADAAFGSIEILKKITTWGGSATLSCPQTVMPWIWELLSHNLPPSHWSAAKLQFFQ